MPCRATCDLIEAHLECRQYRTVNGGVLVDAYCRMMESVLFNSSMRLKHSLHFFDIIVQVWQYISKRHWHRHQFLSEGSWRIGCTEAVALPAL